MTTPISRPLHVMLLDDHDFILHGICLTLSAHSDIRVLGSYTHSQQLFAALARLTVDVVVMDYCLRPGEMDGLNLIRGLRLRCPQARVLVISSLYTPATVSLALRCGATGFIGKELDAEVLPTAVRKVASGQVYVHPSMAARLADNDVEVDDLVGSPSATEGSALTVRSSTLTIREHEVLRCCLQGQSVTDIAQKFSRSVKTISAQKQSAFRKLGLRNNNELFNSRSQFEGWQ